MRTTLLKTSRLSDGLKASGKPQSKRRWKLTSILMFFLLVNLLFMNNSSGQTLSTALASAGSNSSSSNVDNPERAYSNNNSYAVYDANGDTARYGTFNIPTTGIVTITGIEVLLEGKREGDRDLRLDLSWNGGTNFTSTKMMPGFDDADATRAVGSVGDTWGRTWSVSELSNANFVVRCTVPAAATGDLSLDHIQVRIYYASTFVSVFTASNSFSVPSGVDNVTVEAWGAGAGGSNATTASGGGGGGAFTKGNISGLTGGNSLTVTVGTGGAVGLPTTAPGNFSRVVFGANTITANGGLSVNNSRNGGAGGAASTIAAPVTASFAGGAGGNARSSSGGSGNESGGGGGGSALMTAAGTTGSNGGNDSTFLTVGGSGSGYGGGGSAADGSPTAAAGYFPGGGGGGRGESSSTSGAGANGLVILTWCTTYSLTSTAAASPICTTAGTSVVTLTGAAANLPVGTYTVTYNRSLPSATGLTASMTVSTAGTGTFTATGLTTAGTSAITVTNIASSTMSCNNAISSNNTSNITVTGTPVANAGNAVNVCYTSGGISVNPDASATAANASSVLWSGGAGTWSSASSLTGATYTPTAGEISAGSVQVTLTANATSPCSGSNAANKTITIGTQPNVNAGSDQTICSSTVANISATITGTGITTTTWSTSGTGSFGNSGSPSTTYTPSAADKSAGSVTLTMTTNDPVGPCTSHADSLVLTYEPEATVNAGADQTVCSNAPVVSLAGTRGGSATSSTWTGGNGTFADASALNTTYTPSAGEISAGGNIVLTLTTDDPAGICGPASDTMTVTINLAATANAGADQDYCTSSANIALSGSRGGTGVTSSTWTTSGTGTFGNAGSLSTTYTPSAADKNLSSITLTLTTNNPAGICDAASDTMVITVFQAATVNAGADIQVCANDPVVTLAGTRGGGATSSLWTGGNGTFADATALNTTYTPSAGEIAAGGNVTLTLTTDNPVGPCNAVSDSMVLTINLPAVANAGADQDYCTSASSVALSGSRSGTGVTSSTWTTSGTGTFGNAGNTSTTYTPSAADKNLASVTLTLTTNNPSGPCDAASDTMVINMYKAATVNAGSNQTACSTHPISLNGSIGGGATSAVWSAPSGTFSDVNSLTSTYTPTIASGSVVLTLTTDDPAGPCNALSSTVTITVNPVPSTAGVAICQGTAAESLTSSVCQDAAPTDVNKLPSAAVNSGTGTAWSNPANVYTNNDQRATVAGSDQNDVVSQTLNITGFNFAIPANATIVGIECGVAKHRSGGLLGGNVQDNSVRLIKSGSEVGTNLGLTSTNWGTSEAVTAYGGASALWGSTWSVADINASNFGVALKVDISQGTLGARTANVDYVEITVTYTLPGSINWYTASSGGSSIGSGTSFNPVGVSGSGLANTNTPGVYTYYAECSTFPGCRTAVNYVINALPDAGFTTLSPVYCQDAGPVSLNSIANHTSGTFSGAGITDNGNGTATFNPAAAGVGPHIITYSYTDGNTCVNQTQQTVNVNANVTYYADLDGDNFGDAGNALVSCTGPQGIYTLTDSSDCDDNLILYTDNDGDGFGSNVKVACGGVTNNTDCNDAQLLYTDVDGDGFGSDTFAACTGVTNTDDCDDNTVRYQDNDNDGFGSLVKVACGGVTNADDCNDAEVLYTDVDGDGFGSDIFAACTGVANSDDCDDNQVRYADADGDGYGTLVKVACGGSTNNTDCDDTMNTVHPGAVEIGYNLIDDDCDGLIDEGFPPKVTTVSNVMCNTVLPTIDSQLYADNVAGAQGYRWRITTMSGPNAGQVQFLDTPLRVMKLTQLGTYAFNTSYKVELAVYYAGYLQPFTTSACTVSTPETTTKLSLCGQNISTMSNVVYANLIPFATGYRFKITDPNNVSNTQIIDRPVREFRMNLINAFAVQYGKTYNVEVSIKNTDGNYLSFGQVCSLTTPVFPTTSLEDANCEDYLVPSSSTQIYAASAPGAIAYAFKLTGPGLPVDGVEVIKSLRAFTLGDFIGLIPSATYNVQVRLIFNFSDAPGPYGKTCTVVAPGLARPAAPVAAKFDAVAYPNPFADNFHVDVTTSADENVSVKVYDMTGKLLENKEIGMSEIKSLEIGDRFPSGVYNVIVNQGEEVKTLRVIKR